MAARRAVFLSGLTVCFLGNRSSATARELAGRAEIACGYVPMMEAAKLRALPSPANIERLARALGTTVGALRGRRR